MIFSSSIVPQLRRLFQIQIWRLLNKKNEQVLRGFVGIIKNKKQVIGPISNHMVWKKHWPRGTKGFRGVYGGGGAEEAAGRRRG